VGVVQAFRRKASPFESARFKLNGLEAMTDYVVTDLDRPETPTLVSGRELMETGLPVNLPGAPQAALIMYRRKLA